MSSLVLIASLSVRVIWRHARRSAGQRPYEVRTRCSAPLIDRQSQVLFDLPIKRQATVTCSTQTKWFEKFRTLLHHPPMRKCWAMLLPCIVDAAVAQHCVPGTFFNIASSVRLDMNSSLGAPGMRMSPTNDESWRYMCID